jgi:fibronectin type 3 domain-containing protein
VSYRCKVTNSAGTTISNPAKFTHTGSALLNPPSGITWTRSPNSVLLNWSAVAGAKYYKIYRSETPGSYTYIGMSSLTTFHDIGLSPFSTYYYVLTTVNASEEEGPRSGPVTVPPAGGLPAPTGVTATRTAVETATIRWNAVTGAHGYAIYRSETAGQQGSQIASVFAPDVNYFDTAPQIGGLKAGVTYYYTVRAMTADLAQGNPSAQAAAPPPPAPQPLPAPTGVFAVRASNSASVEWNAVAGAHGYAIYRSESLGQRGSQIASVPAPGNSYLDSGAQIGSLNQYVTYYYTVAAYDTNYRQGALSSQATAEATSRLPAPQNVTVIRIGTAAAVEWDSVNFASRYRVYRSATSGSQGTLIASPTSSYYDDAGPLQAGVNYYYTVTAVNNGGLEGVASAPRIASK